MKTPTTHGSSQVKLHPENEAEKTKKSATTDNWFVLYIKSKLNNISQMWGRLCNIFAGKKQAAATVAAKNPDPVSTQNINKPNDDKPPINFSDKFINQSKLPEVNATNEPIAFIPASHSTNPAEQALPLQKFGKALTDIKASSILTWQFNPEQGEIIALNKNQNNFSPAGIKRLCAVIKRDSFKELFKADDKHRIRWNNINQLLENPQLDQPSPKATQKEIALHQKCTDGHDFLNTIMKQYPDQAAITNLGTIKSDTESADRMQENIVALSMLRTLLDAAADL
ncbi:MAG: hypothetical protein WBJ21_01590 [Burkholderiaceae bacterium]